MNNTLVQNPFFGIVLTIAVFYAARKVRDRIDFPLFNPLLTSIIAVIIILKSLKVEYNDYYTGGKILNSLIGPATVAMAIPLYKKFELLKKHYKSIIISIVVANTLNVFLMLGLAKLFSYSNQIIVSFMPKSVTTAIAVGITENLKGVISITVVLVIITGITTAILGPEIYRLLKIENDIVIGISLGSSGHAIATSRAIEHSEEAGVIASISLIVTGLYIIILVPIVFRFLI